MKSKKFTMGLLIFYLIVLTWIIIFKLQFSFENLPHIRNINLIPFGESVIINGKMDFGEIIQNALAFIPFGVLMHVLWEEKSMIKQMAPVVAVSLLYEIIQFLFAVGATDITDVIANSLSYPFPLSVTRAESSQNAWKDSNVRLSGNSIR